MNSIIMDYFENIIMKKKMIKSKVKQSNSQITLL